MILTIVLFQLNIIGGYWRNPQYLAGGKRNNCPPERSKIQQLLTETLLAALPPCTPLPQLLVAKKVSVIFVYPADDPAFANSF